MGSRLSSAASAPLISALPLSVQQAALAYSIDGGGATIGAGIAGDIVCPFSCTITAATLLADASGSIVIDLWKAAYAAYPPTIANTIVASALPTISSALKSQDSTLTGWSKSLAAGDVVRVNVNSCTGVSRCAVILSVTRA